LKWSRVAHAEPNLKEPGRKPPESGYISLRDLHPGQGRIEEDEEPARDGKVGPDDSAEARETALKACRQPPGIASPRQKGVLKSTAAVKWLQGPVKLRSFVHIPGEEQLVH